MNKAAVVPFDLLSPDLIAESVAEAYGLKLEGVFFPYPSYINRVYGLRAEDGTEYVVKFYRPGRWEMDAIREEHGFLAELGEAECPVIRPLEDSTGETLQQLVLETTENEVLTFPFSLFPKRGGRSFDAESDTDWLRLGALAGRVHAVGRRQTARHRSGFLPGLLDQHARELLDAGLIHPECTAEFMDACAGAALILDPLLARTQAIRLHGDFHRGNILDRTDEGLLLIDFDDMASGPAVQDLWLLLPGRLQDCSRETNLLLEGYADFADFDRNELALIEPLRFLRMVHFLVWQSRQRFDAQFNRAFPDWGTRSFWIKETEDLRDQLRALDRD